MDLALYVLDKLKAVFARFRVHKRQQNQDGHFNFLKWHVLSHYTHFIHRYGTLDGTDTSQTEAAHKFLIKENFTQTNK